MNKFYSYGLSAALLLGGLGAAAQNRPAGPIYSPGSSQALVRQLESQVAAGKAQRQTPTVTLQVSDAQSFTGKVNYREDLSATGEYVVGELQGIAGSSFLLRINGTRVDGNIILRNTKQAYKYSADAQGNVTVQEVDINEVICIDYNLPTGYQSSPAPAGTASRTTVASLQSFPGARGCVMLDLDGQYVSGTGWNNGNPINAAPARMVNDAGKVQALWELVSEDFRPFSINVTTDEAVFNSYPKNMRMRCIITPTNTAAPGAGGVAFVGSFNSSDNPPCWVFMSDDPKSAGEAASHEVGHTLGLGHDGRTSPSEGYYQGQGSWAPIMGVGYYKPVSQWSRGEYANANNTQDDLAIMSGSRFNVGYRNDDHSNAIAGATALARNGNSVSGQGIIERTSDQDYFSFSTSGGAVTLNVNTVGRYGNLDIVARLFNSGGTLIGTFDTGGGNNLNATVSANLGAGTYYLQVDGTSSGNPATDGYSDYASLGTFTIAGTVPAGSTPPPPPPGVATLYRDCNFGNTATGLGVGDYNLAALQARGVLNDDLSSLKVNSGYEVQLFANDNFSGESITVVGNADCLVGRSFNDKTSSLRVRTAGTATVYEDCNFGGYARALPAIGSYTTNQLAALGILNDDLSSLKVNSGFQVVLYENDNFSGASLTVTSENSCLVGAGWNDRVSSIRVQATGGTASVLLQAETHSYNNGMVAEGCSDAGGGQNMGYVDNGDYLVFNGINFPSSGTYTIEYRVASAGGGTVSSDLNAGAIVLGTTAIPATGGWQNWTTVSRTVNVTAGTYNFGVYAQAGGWNINWIRISPTSGVASGANVASSAAPVASLALELYPNPVADRLMLAGTELQGTEEVSILSLEGKVVWRGTASGASVDVSALKPGIYTLVVQTADQRQLVGRFSKQ